jgi:succinate dehydrogenase hydrophobic anchor subunit
MSSPDVRLLRVAFIAVVAAALLFCVIFALMFFSVMNYDPTRQQYPYELVMAGAGTVYFALLGIHAWRGLRRALDPAELGQTLRVLSQSVLLMFAALAAAALILIWLIFGRAYFAG